MEAEQRIGDRIKAAWQRLYHDVNELAVTDRALEYGGERPSLGVSAALDVARDAGELARLYNELARDEIGVLRATR